MNRTAWVVFITSQIMLMSLVFAALTDNPNWPLNIPLSILMGVPFGLATYRWGNR